MTETLKKVTSVALLVINKNKILIKKVQGECTITFHGKDVTHIGFLCESDRV